MKNFIQLPTRSLKESETRSELLFQELGKMKRTWIMNSIIMIAIGVLLIMCPVRYMGMVVSALGYLLLVGATVMALDFLSSKKALINYVSLTIALIIALLGLFVMVNRGDVLPMLSLIFGLVMVVTGIYDFFNAFVYTRRAGQTAWGLLAVLAVLTIVFGIVLLINPWWETPVKLKTAIGVMLLFSSVVSIIRVVITWPFKSV